METPATPGASIRYTLLFAGTCRRTRRLRTRGYDSPGATDSHIAQAAARALSDLSGPRYLRAAVRRAGAWQ